MCVFIVRCKLCLSSSRRVFFEGEEGGEEGSYFDVFNNSASFSACISDLNS